MGNREKGRCLTLEKECIYFDDIKAVRAEQEKQAAAKKEKRLAEEKLADPSIAGNQILLCRF